MPSGSNSSSSSLAFLTSQLEETRANQMKERSKRTLELMRTAVEWQSWEELRTLTKAFQVYLEEIRETDQRRKRDLETSISRVWAARHQLAKADRHKDEAIAQAELLRTENSGLRHQLEFDARQFVALLQSCAHLERQLAELRQRHGEEVDEISSFVTRNGVALHGGGEAACDPSSPSSCFSHAKAAVDLARRSPSKGVSEPSTGEEAAIRSSWQTDHQCCDRSAEVQKGLVDCAGDTNPRTSTEKEKALSQEMGIQGSAAKAPLERLATEVLVRTKEAQDDEGFEGHSPFGTTQLSETSTVVAMSPSDAWNSPSSRHARRLEALRVLSALADLKKKLELCSSTRVSQGREKHQDALVSTTDGTGLASPGDAQAEDAEDVSAVETGTSRSSVGHSPAGTLGESLRGRGNGKLVLGPRVSFASQSRCSEEQNETDQESPSSPFLRPSALAAGEASRLAAMKTQVKASFELSREEERREVEPTVHSMSQLAGGWGTRITTVPLGGAALEAGGTLVQVTRSAPGVSEQNGAVRQAVPGPDASHTCRSLASSLASISASSDGRRTLGSQPKQGLRVVPVPPASPSKPSPEQSESHATSRRQPRKEGGPVANVDRQPDASYVAPIKLVRELNNMKVPSAHSGPKEAHQSAGSKAYCREKPMTRDMNNSPQRRRRSGHEEQNSTKASL